MLLGQNEMSLPVWMPLQDHAQVHQMRLRREMTNIKRTQRKIERTQRMLDRTQRIIERRGERGMSTWRFKRRHARVARRLRNQQRRIDRQAIELGD